MKNILIPALLLLTIIGLWWGASTYTEKAGTDLKESMRIIYDCSADANWRLADKEMAAFLKDWSKISKIYALYMDEKILQAIENSAERCDAYIYVRDSSLACGEAAEIICNLKLVMGDDRFVIPGLI